MLLARGRSSIMWNYISEQEAININSVAGRMVCNFEEYYKRRDLRAVILELNLAIKAVECGGFMVIFYLCILARKIPRS